MMALLVFGFSLVKVPIGVFFSSGRLNCVWRLRDQSTTSTKSDRSGEVNWAFLLYAVYIQHTGPSVCDVERSVKQL